jgi:hypothetical protein
MVESVASEKFKENSEEQTDGAATNDSSHDNDE